MTKNRAKKGVLALALASVLGSGVFAQEDKHQPFDMLLGLNSGSGITPNIGEVFTELSNERIPKGNYAVLFDFGITYDFYLFNFLSFNTGLLMHPDVYVILDQDFSGVDDFTKIAASPICLTIPLGAHVNIPKVEWLYAGIGLSLNIPLFGMFDGMAGLDIDTKGDFFVGLPIDIGFDFISPGRGGGRFFFRITPEFHEKGTAVPIGFVWQIYNWKIYSKK
ncbi:MAG: hypothetical protein LBD93_00620 [Treponema sp.]|jgi:hypothetical protein|nr:hypothetical protein [Treponema sp.]